MSKLVIIKAILAKQVSRGCTPGEEAAAVAKAVELIGKYAIPHSAVAADWPAGWDYQGKRHEPTPVAPKMPLKEAMKRAGIPVAPGKSGGLGHYAEELLMRHYPEMGSYDYAEIIRRVKARYPGAKTSVSSLRWYEAKLRKEGKTVPKRK